MPLGNPLGLEFRGSVTTGVISALNRSVDVGERNFKLIQTDAAINPGNSGGALVNADGQVIGINSAKVAVSGVEGIGFAIPINEAKPILEALAKNGGLPVPFSVPASSMKKQLSDWGLDSIFGAVSLLRNWWPADLLIKAGSDLMTLFLSLMERL